MLAYLRQMSPSGLDPVVQWVNSPVVRRACLSLAALFLCLGLALAIRANPGLLATIDFRPVLVCALVAVPLAILSSALEYDLSARLAGVRIPPGEVLKTTIIGSAANLLPIPGAAMVRIAGIKAAGSNLVNGAAATTFSAALWPATGALAAGFAGMMLGHTLAGALLAGAGAVTLVGVLALAFARFQRFDLPAALLGVKALQVGIEVLRLSLCLAALGSNSDLLVCAVLNMANVVGSLVSIVPAGLGVREAAAVALAPLLALSVSLTFLAVAVNRILGLAIVAPLAVILAARPVRRTIG